MSQRKKEIRDAFREAVFKRDRHRCRVCGIGNPGLSVGPGAHLDAHHITDRNQMPNGGYVAENGISLCNPCHEKAEAFHATGTAHPGFSPEDLYKLIGSTHAEAIRASERLKCLPTSMQSGRTP